MLLITSCMHQHRCYVGSQTLFKTLAAGHSLVWM
uniref:Uncharacterized protein n=1 Tax=Arundo donax TaxID=35708 RepID=A0A0A9BKU9_ARUDO